MPFIPVIENPWSLIFHQIIGRTVCKIHRAAMVFHGVRLPHTEKPIAVPSGIPFQSGYFTAQLDRFADNVTEDGFSVVSHHLGGDIQRSDHAVLGGSRTMHHI